MAEPEVSWIADIEHDKGRCTCALPTDQPGSHEPDCGIYQCADGCWRCGADRMQAEVRQLRDLVDRLAGEPLSCQNCGSGDAVTITVCQGCAFLIKGAS